MSVDWDKAKCRGLNSLFFPSTDVAASNAAAVAICRTCPLTGDHGPCMERALVFAADGVWAGHTYDEISKLRKKAGIARSV